MDIKDFLSILNRQKVVVGITAATFLGLWFFFGFFNERPVYIASAKAISTPSVQTLSRSIGEDVSRFISPAINTDIAKSLRVLELAREFLASPSTMQSELPASELSRIESHPILVDIKEIENSIFVEPKENKLLFTITARASDAQKAIAIANAVAVALKKRLKEYATEHYRRAIEQKKDQLEDRKKLKTREETTLQEIALAEGIEEDVASGEIKRYQLLMADLDQKRIMLDTRIQGIEGRVDATRKRKEEIMSKEFVPEVEIPPTEMVKDLQMKILQQQIQMIEQMVRYTETHPAVDETRQRIAYYEEQKALEEKKMEESRPLYVERYKQSLLKESEKHMVTLNEEKESSIRELESVSDHMEQLMARSEKWKGYIEQEAVVNRVAGEIQDYDQKIKDWSDKQAAMPDLIEVEQPARASILEARKSVQMLPFFAVLAVVVGMGIGFLRDYLDDRIKTAFDVKRYLNWPVIGTVPLSSKATEVLLLNAAPRSPLVEIYSRIAIIMSSYLQKEGCKVFMLTSVKPQEGKTTLVSNLGIAMARMGKRGVLVDCDLRHPSLHKTFKIENSIGLSSYLSGKLEARSELKKISELPIVVLDSDSPADVSSEDMSAPSVETASTATGVEGGLADVIHESEVDGLSIIPCGPSPANPLALLESANFKAMLEQLRDRYEFVLLDTPPLESTTDPLVISRHVDATVLVASCWDTKKYELTWGKRMLNDIGARVIGVILNRSTSQTRGYYYYYSDRGSQQTTS